MFLSMLYWLQTYILQKYMRSRKQILKKLEQCYVNIQNKRKNKSKQLQVDNEFQQVKIKGLNGRDNVMMYTTSLSGRKNLCYKKKIRELKSRKFKLKALSHKIKAKLPAVIIKDLPRIRAI